MWLALAYRSERHTGERGLFRILHERQPAHRPDSAQTRRAVVHRPGQHDASAAFAEGFGHGPKEDIGRWPVTIFAWPRHYPDAAVIDGHVLVRRSNHDDSVLQELSVVRMARSQLASPGQDRRQYARTGRRDVQDDKQSRREVLGQSGHESAQRLDTARRGGNSYCCLRRMDVVDRHRLPPFAPPKGSGPRWTRRGEADGIRTRTRPTL